jgi:hypothetical protein
VIDQAEDRSATADREPTSEPSRPRASEPESAIRRAYEPLELDRVTDSDWDDKS